IDGVNLMPYLNGEKKSIPHEHLFWRNFDRDRYAVRSADQKMITEQGTPSLYQITEDIGETNNTAAANSKVVRKLEKRLNTWKSSNLDPVFLGLSQDSVYSAQHPDRWK